MLFGILLGLCLPVMAACVDVMAVSVALHTIMRNLNASMMETQWLLSSYTLGTAAFLIVIGKVADLYGRRKILLWGLLLFGCSSLLAAFSSNIVLLIMSRWLQGVSSAMMMTSALSIITHSFAPEKRGAMVAHWGTGLGLGMAMGPIVGGIILHWLNWRFIFLANIPVCLVAYYCIVKYVPESKNLQACTVNWFSALLLAAFFTVILLGLTQPSTMLLLIFLIVLAGFLLTDYFSKVPPIVDFSLFQCVNFTSATLSGALSYFCMYGWLFLFNIYLQKLFNFNALTSSLLCVPFSIAFALSMKLISRFNKKVFYKRFIFLGFLIASLDFLAYLVTPKTYFILLGVLAFFLGIAITLINAPTIAAATEYIPVEKSGAASGIIFTVRWLGGSVGVTVVSMVLHYYGFRNAYLGLFFIALMGMISAIFLKISNNRSVQCQNTRAIAYVEK